METTVNSAATVSNSSNSSYLRMHDGGIPVCDPYNCAMHVFYASDTDGYTRHESWAAHIVKGGNSFDRIVEVRHGVYSTEYISFCEALQLVERIVKSGGFVHTGEVYVVK